MANRNFPCNKMYTGHVMPVLIDCNFVVDSTNGNGLGIRSLKGPYVKAVYMASSAPSSKNPMVLGQSSLKSAGTFAILGASAVTNTGSSVLTGDLGIFPGTSITGFPPGTFTGNEDIANAVALRAQNDALALYTQLAALSTTTIPSALDGQTLVPGNYSFASGAATLAQSAGGTLTLNGAGRYVIKTASTLTTGAGGVPVIALTGGATAANVFWIIGSSATINSGNAGTFQGNIIAQASITDTLGGTVNGSMIALTGAVTLSAATNVNASPSAIPGTIVVQLEDNYNRSLTGFSSIVSPVSGTALTAVVAGTAYVIVSLGTATLSQWQAVGVPKGLTPAVGLSFIASSSATIGGSAAVETSVASGITNIETIGDPNLSIAPALSANQGFGSQFILQCYSDGIKAAPADGTVISLAFLLSNSSVLVAGE